MALDSIPCLDNTMALSDSVSLSNQHVPSSCIGLRHPHDHRLQPRSQASLWTLVAACAMTINTDLGVVGP